MYTVTSSRSNRNINYNTGNILITNNIDYNNEIYQLDNTLGSIRLSTYYHSVADNIETQYNDSSWYIESPEIPLPNTKFESVIFYISLGFENENVPDRNPEYFFIQIKRISEPWTPIKQISTQEVPDVTNQNILRLDRSDMRSNSKHKYQIDITDRINAFNYDNINIRFITYNWFVKDYVEIGSYLIKYTFYE